MMLVPGNKRRAFLQIKDLETALKALAITQGSLHEVAERYE
jgi:hypothetical protein